MKAESFEVQPSDLKLNVRPRVAIRTVSPSPLLVIARTHATTSHGEENRVIETYIYTYIYTNIYVYIYIYIHIIRIRRGLGLVLKDQGKGKQKSR